MADQRDNEYDPGRLAAAYGWGALKGIFFFAIGAGILRLVIFLVTGA